MKISKIKLIILSLTLGISAWVLISGGSKAFAAPATFTVTNTNDSGAGSLRQALIDANANGNSSDVDVITFNISGGGVQTISPATSLPQITEPVEINGYSQPGSSANTAPSPQPINSVITIAINGGPDAGGTQTRLDIAATAPGTIIRGISMYGCGVSDQEGCVRTEADQVVIAGNFLGVMPDGSTAGSYEISSAIIQYGGSNLTIGGTSPAARNILSNKEFGQQAVNINSSTGGTVIQGNYIGLAKDGITSLNTIGGVGLNTSAGTTVGGAASGTINVIHGTQIAVLMTSSNAVVQGNYIGTDYTGSPRSSLSSAGIAVSAGGHENLIGGTNPGEGNIIAGTNGSGVTIARLTINGMFDGISIHNSILGNSIYSLTPGDSGGAYPSLDGLKLAIVFSQAIDSDADFVPNLYDVKPYNNDVSDADVGTNNLMNHPILNTAVQNGNQLEFNYDLDTADSPSNQYRVEFFASDSSELGTSGGMAQTFLGAVTVSPGSAQSSSITLPSNTSLNGKIFSATATAVDNTLAFGYGSTSRVSPAISLTSESNTTTNTNTEGSQNTGTSNTTSTAQLASTGQNTKLIITAAILLTIVGLISCAYVVVKPKAAKSKKR